MKIIKIILKVIYNLLFALLLLSATFVFLTTFNLIPGYNFYIVMSGSMEPAIHTGSITAVHEESDYNIQDVITVKMKNDPSQTYTHRIVEKLEEDTVSFKTKGDANESQDPDIAQKDQVLGKVIFSIPVIGYLANFAKQPTGFILMVIVPSIIIAASELNVMKDEFQKIISKSKQNKKDEI
ncbi:signal peptidase I [Candidatus Microgenomates bacterium]|nr:signal peptidase I [Candidatus Microgenomates bacterium]